MKKKSSTKKIVNILQAKILPLRLYVDQDAVDFLKKFFSFKDLNAQVSEPASNEETYIRAIYHS
jgi:autophagy-related protein 2